MSGESRLVSGSELFPRRGGRRGPWGRLLGYERDQEVRGPSLLEVAARKILRRNTTTVAWESPRL